MRIDALLADPPDLPVVAALAGVRAAVRRGAVVVQAPPGTGKTTLVPPAVAAEVGGRVLVTQPRRVAARAAARHLAGLLGEDAGTTVGYSVRGESRTSPATRVEMVTTGVLLRRLQSAPDLPGVGAVILDEVHERALEADLALALLVDVRTNLREDLPVVAMSATIEASRTAGLLGPGTPVVAVTAATHPVHVHWCPPAEAARTGPYGVRREFLDHVGAVTRRALAEQDGDLLVFVPGAREVDEVVRRLAGTGVDVLPLHGRLSPERQDRALSRSGRRRVVVSTALAESSLTVPGVRVVVDAGLSREPRTDHRRGMGGLVTVSVARSSAEQRAGRAGREAPGAVYRCWSRVEDARLRDHPLPEIATADLTAFALELASWGTPDGSGLALLDPPPGPAMAAARATLEQLGALTSDGAVTPRGAAMAGAGVHPRLARALLDGAPAVGARRAAEVVALLGEDVRAPGADLVAALRQVRREHHPGWARQVRRLTRTAEQSAGAAGRAAGGLPDDAAAGYVVALAHPERLARRRGDGDAYLMVSGTGAVLPPGSALTGAPWLAVAEVDRSPGRSDGVVRAAVPVDADTALEAAAGAWHEEETVTWRDGALVARRVTRLGAIELTSTPVRDTDPALVARALRDGLAGGGLEQLPWTPAATALRARLAFLHRALGGPWPDVSGEALLDRLPEWLGPDLVRVRGDRDLRRLDLLVALRRLLPWPEAGRLDELAPERVTVPSGSAVRVDYSGAQPLLAVRLQEVLGWTESVRLAGGRVPLVLHLLSPARRPLAVTADLASFWAGAYPGVRAEMRGRYPRHEWPEDPLTAAPTRGARRRT